ncbi:MAG TPA: hypothetical protein VGK59_07155 [Ohtaekwangia sp.]
MEIFIRAYRWLNVLSIDVALGSACSALFFSKLFQVTILPYGLIALAVTVWVIYTVDHLLDARKIAQPASTTRHHFHQTNFRVLVKLVLIAVIMNSVLIFFIRKPVLLAGVFLFAGVGFYLLVQQYMKVSKEIVIALLYTIGVALPSMAVTDLPVSEWPWLILVQFFLTALTNLILFAWFDRERDQKDKRSSVATAIGEQGSRYILSALLVTSILITFFSTYTIASVFILVGNLILLIIFMKRSLFEQHDRFRLLGDAIFFIPLLYWLI